MSDRPDFSAYLERLPLVAILRGIAPEQAAETARMLVDEGFTIIEVPMNSPRPLDSIAAVAEAVGDRALVGAGTVLRPGPGDRDRGGRGAADRHAPLRRARPDDRD